MKIECSCGAKYEFEVRPEMREHPVTFVCPACGLDASTFVDGLIRQELGQSGTPGGPPVPVLRASPPIPVRIASAAAVPSGVRLQKPVPAAASAAGPAAAEPVPCLKHPGEQATQRCSICSKPICPKCMELFGYVCSPLCKAKADSHGIQLPLYEGHKSVIEARRWRKLVWAATGAGVLLVLLLSLWFWYAWFGCLPKPAFSIRFPVPAYSGQSAFCGEHRDQIVFLHGVTLARCDLKSGKEIWSRDLLDHNQIQRAIDQQLQADKAIVDKANSEAWDQIPKMPSPDELKHRLELAAAAALSLHTLGQNIWVSAPGKLVHYDWGTGKTLEEIPVPAGSSGVIHRGGELLFVEAAALPPVITHVDLASGQTRTENLSAMDARLLAQNPPQAGSSGGEAAAGLPSPGKDAGKPMDPAKVAAQAQHMSLAQKMALPAVLAVNMNQQRALNELNDERHTSTPGSAAREPQPGFSLIPAQDGFVELSVKLLEVRFVTRSAMKPGTGKSVLEGDVTAGKSMEMSNDMLNEMQRSNGGDQVQEDHSRYEVTVRRPGSDTKWTGEVVGWPALYPLDSVNVLAADKTILVLDKANNKLWQGTLGFNIPAGINALDEESATYGQGPCVERKGTLYVFDEGVLSAFDLRSGNARWRLPTVGVAGIFFDDADMMYVNTTTASHESLKYSRQIDLSSKVLHVILKVDSRNGKILWRIQSQGLVNYVSGRLILTAQSYQPQPREGPYPGDDEFEQGPWMRIRRLHPRNGRQIWEYFQDRAPLDIAFDGNTIRLVFKKEVQVLHFPSL